MEYAFALIMGWQAGNWHQANKGAQVDGMPEITLGPVFWPWLSMAGLFAGWLTIIPAAIIVAFVGSGGWVAFGIFFLVAIVGAFLSGIPILAFTGRVYVACAAPVVSGAILFTLFFTAR